MSETAHNLSKTVRRLCRSCAERKALFRYRGVVKADRDHTLCFECYRAERDRRRAQRLTELPAAQLPHRPAPRSLTGHDVEHRRRMLAHLGATRQA